MDHVNGDSFMVAVICTEFFGCLGYALCFNMVSQIELVPLFLLTMVICTQKISGGHINPAITFGVYLEKQRYGTKFCFALTTIIAQMLGGLTALMLGYCLRVTLPTPGRENSYYFVPDQNPFFPEIIDEVRGQPAYGQVFLAECLGGAILTYVVLSLKMSSDSAQDLYTYPIGYAVCSIAVNQLFNQVSSGVFNPSLAFSQICWQNLTYFYSKEEVDGAYWTPEYAVSYILGPMVGAYFGANMFNFMKINLKRLKEGNTTVNENDDEQKESLVNQFAFSLTEQMNSLKKAGQIDEFGEFGVGVRAPKSSKSAPKKKKGNKRSQSAGK